MARRARFFGAAEEWLIAACMKQVVITGRPYLGPAFLQSLSVGRPRDEDLVKAYRVLERAKWATGRVVMSDNAAPSLHSVCLTQQAVEAVRQRG